MERWIESGSEITRLSIEGTTTYWTGAAARGATPWDVFDDVRRWWIEASRRERPRWYSPNDVVLECPVARLRDFSQGSKADVVPTLVLPPQAGHDSCIVDFSPEQSQMKVIRAAGLERAFSLEWIGATAETREAGIEDYLSFIERSIEHIGGPVNLIGDCQGGWLATIYAALHPEHVNTLTLAGAPIDFHAGDPVIGDWVDALGSDDLAFYRWVVEQGGGVLKGDHMLNGFIMIKPENEVAKQVQLMTHLHDDEHLERHHHFETWFKHVQDIPAPSTSGSSSTCSWRTASSTARWRSAASASTSRGSTARCSCSAARATTSRRPTRCSPRPTTSAPRPPDIEKHVNSGGHLGLFMGSEALREHWPPIMAAVFARSRPNADTAAAKSNARSQTRRKRPAIPAP